MKYYEFDPNGVNEMVDFIMDQIANTTKTFLEKGNTVNIIL